MGIFFSMPSFESDEEIGFGQKYLSKLQSIHQAQQNIKAHETFNKPSARAFGELPVILRNNVDVE